ncbi:hypothetical protein GH714_031042 [Hevea brasiliensis]|uniref:Rhamnogalacturonase A/B/Epimerase-like pectate lyase domain-containing protein n=1 Tax=Hevea brasiliensis TaxID=3981 RepID=A0A6A6NKB3_HEVBR|nr:hypothetical protein GH714_031042 [Hevea brasiliensis]
MQLTCFRLNQDYKSIRNQFPLSDLYPISKRLMANIMLHYLLFLVFFWSSFRASNGAYNVESFGAKPDGLTDSTQAFLKAWSAACGSTGPATLYVPSGSFLVKPIVFNGPCKNKILFWIDGKILAPTNYWSFGSSGFWILFYQISWLPSRVAFLMLEGSISFVASRNVVVSGLTSINSQIIHIAIDQCRNILLEKLKITASSLSPNTDGIHMQSSIGITITNTTIKTGDDCISIGPGSMNVRIQRITCGPGHGISVGSLAEHTHEDGVQNVTVTSAVFTGTQNGVRIKSWGRPSSGFANNIIFQNIIMKNAYNPIIIDQKYCPSGHGCPNQNSGVKISG